MTPAAFVARPFVGLPDEPEWVALREIVPSATAPLSVAGYEDRDVQLSTVLPLAWPAMVRADGRVLLGLQVAGRSTDVSRDLAHALLTALESAPGASITSGPVSAEGPRLQDLLSAPLQITLHDGFDHWLEGVATDRADEIEESMQRASASVVPTARVEGLTAAYWCRMPARSHVRWVLPEDEEPLLDALARLAVAGGLGLGEGTRYVGSFRAHGLLVPVWDLPHAWEAEDLAAPMAALRTALDEVLAAPRALDPAERRARSGLLSRQLTLR
ncbi:MAG: hypothetical protein JWL64_2629 [Frankiales bacterium]|nr:hypothetical protein [Frankiales bacterium]